MVAFDWQGMTSSTGVPGGIFVELSSVMSG